MDAAVARSSSRTASRSRPRPASARGIAVVVPKTSVTVSESIQHSDPRGTSSRREIPVVAVQEQEVREQELRQVARVGAASAPKSVVLDSKSHQRGFGMPAEAHVTGDDAGHRRRAGGGDPGGEVERVPVERAPRSRARPRASAAPADVGAPRSRAASRPTRAGSPLATAPQVDSTHAMKAATALVAAGLRAPRSSDGLGGQRPAARPARPWPRGRARRRRWRGPRRRRGSGASAGSAPASAGAIG